MLKLVTFSLALSLTGCALFEPNFYKARSPAGVFCSDMAVIPNAQRLDRPFHRLAAVASAPTAQGELERLESIRRAACRVKADAIVEVTVSDDAKTSDGRYYTRIQGFSAVWLAPERAPEVAATLPQIPTSAPRATASQPLPPGLFLTPPR